MMKTRTGNFSIGFRRGGSKWQQDLSALIAWTVEHKLEVLDLGQDGDQTAPAVLDAGLRVGSVDLAEWHGMISADKGKRDEAIAQNTTYIRTCAAYGAMNHFLVMLPENPELPRAENFAYMVDSFNQLAPILEEHQAKIVIEGWPGPGALCCTPADYRAFFKECPSLALGLNYDPSHLVRMGIDPLRFLTEFSERVYHVHGKDTEILSENLYQHGHEQPATFAPEVAFGSFSWRYTIPGHGQIPWVEVFRVLAAADYSGCVSLELEDANFNGQSESEKVGILQGTHFLAGC